MSKPTTDETTFSSAPTKSQSEIILEHRGYNRISKLGEGTFAKIYIYEYIEPGKSTDSSEIQPRKLACKKMETKNCQADFVKKFLPRELNILSQVKHPHIIYIQSIYEMHDNFYIFMRYAENGDLLTYISNHKLINENLARIWFRQIVLALQYLHAGNIAHRDLKCENILLTANYNVKLSDFGFARFVMDQRKKLQLSETYCGSLSYTAPEILNARPYNPKCADLWSLGVVTFVMLNKSMPFDESNVKSLYEHQLRRNWTFRSKIVHKLSEQVKTLVRRLLEPEPLKRFQMNEIVNCDWLMMDEKLKTMNENETQALVSAKDLQNTLNKRKSHFIPTILTRKRDKSNTLSVLRNDNKREENSLLLDEANKKEPEVAAKDDKEASLSNAVLK